MGTQAPELPFPSATQQGSSPEGKKPDTSTQANYLVLLTTKVKLIFKSAEHRNLDVITSQALRCIPGNATSPPNSRSPAGLSSPFPILSNVAGFSHFAPSLSSCLSSWHRLWQIFRLSVMARHGGFPWKIAGRGVDRQTLASAFNTLSLLCASVSHLHSMLSAGATTPQCKQPTDAAESDLPGLAAWLESEALCDSSYEVSSSWLRLETPLGSKRSGLGLPSAREQVCA